MTTKTISGTYAGGYTLSASYSQLDITSSGSIGGSGLTAPAYATINNYGMVGGNGLYLLSGGSVTNGSGSTPALISGGVGIYGASGTVTNYGTIEDAAGSAVYMQDGGDVTNGISALIQGVGDNFGVWNYTHHAYITNFGTISGAYAGVYLEHHGTGHHDSGTVNNYGTIEGGTYSVLFQLSSDVLEIESGSALIGTAYGGGGTLELGAGAGAGAGTISGLGSQYTGFASYVVASYATWTVNGPISGVSNDTINAGATLELTGSVASGQTVSFAYSTGDLILNDPSGSSLSFSGVISGFGGSNQIDLPTFTYNAGTTLVWNQTGSDGTLTITDGVKSAGLTLDGSFTSANFYQAPDGIGGMLILHH